MKEYSLKTKYLGKIKLIKFAHNEEPPLEFDWNEFLPEVINKTINSLAFYLDTRNNNKNIYNRVSGLCSQHNINFNAIEVDDIDGEFYLLKSSRLLGDLPVSNGIIKLQALVIHTNGKVYPLRGIVGALRSVFKLVSDESTYRKNKIKSVLLTNLIISPTIIILDIITNHYKYIIISNSAWLADVAVSKIYNYPYEKDWFYKLFKRHSRSYDELSEFRIPSDFCIHPSNIILNKLGHLLRNINYSFEVISGFFNKIYLAFKNLYRIPDFLLRKLSKS